MFLRFFKPLGHVTIKNFTEFTPIFSNANFSYRFKMTDAIKRVRIDSTCDNMSNSQNPVVIPDIGKVTLPLVKGDLSKLTPQVQQFIAKYVCFFFVGFIAIFNTRAHNCVVYSLAINYVIFSFN